MVLPHLPGVYVSLLVCFYHVSFACHLGLTCLLRMSLLLLPCPLCLSMSPLHVSIMPRLLVVIVSVACLFMSHALALRLYHFVIGFASFASCWCLLGFWNVSFARLCPSLVIDA